MLEAEGSVKHEFFDGEIYAMAGGTIEHAALVGEVILALGRLTAGGPSRVYPSDLRIRVQETGLATYPDASVICGAVERDPEDPRTTAINPRVVVEVLSDSTEDYDRGAKRGHYQRIPSLEAYLLVSQRERLLELWSRGPGGAWTRTEARSGASLPLLGGDLEADALYDAALGREALR